MKSLTERHIARGLLLAVAATGLAGGVAAQEGAGERPIDRDSCICFDREPGEALLGGTFMRANRARIGVLLGAPATVDGSPGVRVEEVEPDAPAEAAGLEGGDVITALNGVALGDDAGQDLVRLMGDVEPGDTVTITYHRDGERRTADVVTDAASGFRALRGGDGFEYRVAPHLDLERFRTAPGRFNTAPGRLSVVTPEGWLRRLAHGGLALVEMNPGLSEYFGTDEGVLVTEVDDDSELGLRAGDVILAINGREVRDTAHLRSILDSYRPDEGITFRIIRHQREQEVVGSAAG